MFTMCMQKTSQQQRSDCEHPPGTRRLSSEGSSGLLLTPNHEVAKNRHLSLCLSVAVSLPPFFSPFLSLSPSPHPSSPLPLPYSPTQGIDNIYTSSANLLTDNVLIVQSKLLLALTMQVSKMPTIPPETEILAPSLLV